MGLDISADLPVQNPNVDLWCLWIVQPADGDETPCAPASIEPVPVPGVVARADRQAHRSVGVGLDAPVGHRTGGAPVAPGTRARCLSRVTDQ